MIFNIMLENNYAMLSSIVHYPNQLLKKLKYINKQCNWCLDTDMSLFIFNYRMLHFVCVFSKLSDLNYDIFGQFVFYLLIFSQYKMLLKLLLCNYNLLFFI